jgi:hypothetical protein
MFVTRGLQHQAIYLFTNEHTRGKNVMNVMFAIKDFHDQLVLITTKRSICFAIVAPRILLNRTIHNIILLRIKHWDVSCIAARNVTKDSVIS